MEQQQEQSLETGNEGISAIRVISLIAVVALLLLAGYLAPIREYWLAVLKWTRGSGAWGPIVVGLLYIPACVLVIPGSILTVGAGALFGVPTGFIAVSIGSTIGACAAFLTGRFLARNWVAGRVARSRKFTAIDNAVGKKGFKIVLLTRISPVFPFNVLNYAFGLTKVDFWKYALATWIGMTPGTFLFVYFGAAAGTLAKAAAEDREFSAGEQWMFWVGLVLAVIIVYWVTRVARHALAEATDEEVIDEDMGSILDGGKPDSRAS